MTTSEPNGIDDSAMAGVDTHKIVFELLDPPGARPIVDLGAGSGAFSQRLFRAGYDVKAYGIDRSQYQAEAPYEVVDLDRGLPDDDESLDGVVAIEILEHLEAPLLLMRDAARALVPGGWMLLTTPNVLSWSAKIDIFLSGNADYFGETEYRQNGHISPVSLPTIERMAERLGLHIEAVTYNVGLLPIPKIRNRYPLRGRYRNKALGQSLIVKLRKVAEPSSYARG